MKVLHVVGRKNHGKTTLIADLARALTNSGVRVGTIKSCHASHELDNPAKDSFKHRQAGAVIVTAVTPTHLAVFAERPEGSSPYEYLQDWYRDCGIVLVEGDTEGPGPKIEVWRASVGGVPVATENCGVVGIVTDEPGALEGVDTELPCWPRSDVPALALQIPSLAKEV